ncbi:uncharacterized protein J8A68_001466 [[Candida] subhashii]|uniref:Uncharacterized protein n=1 Tax=[Candida] subhashii TaxID=561895 RepID=A0A8J5QI06_9ASCO|nr:uncharacterized protein J8A68_001466 [[Candida] subhashii]KAG7665001.1 hypothetical protein J8A68_001466 [[Candida] subhashii]
MSPARIHVGDVTYFTKQEIIAMFRARMPNVSWSQQNRTGITRAARRRAIITKINLILDSEDYEQGIADGEYILEALQEIWMQCDMKR